MNTGEKVFQYDYVERREVVGVVTGTKLVFSANLESDIDVADVEWDCGVTTTHRITEFSRVAGRDGVLLAG